MRLRDLDHVVSSQQFDRGMLEELFTLADQIEDLPSKRRRIMLEGKIMASTFYEPSTRTRFSFESAMLRLGGDVITTENARRFSSAAKGESLEDSIRVVGGYAHVIVLRHDKLGAAERAAAVSTVPLINGGDGPGQHPTQALLDAATIRGELGRIDGIHVAFVGDNRYSRTIRSLAYILGKYERVQVTFVSPKALRIGDDIKEYLDRHGVSYTETEDLYPVITEADVVYVVRTQKERFANGPGWLSQLIGWWRYKRNSGIYQIDRVAAEAMKQGAIIMHPLPRLDEILPEVDELPQAMYFKQAAHYGPLVRMALLHALLAR